MQAIWRHYVPVDEPRDLAFDLGELATRMYHWRPAAGFYLASLQYRGEHTATHYNLAMAYWQLAQQYKAEQHLARTVALAPGNPLYRQQWDMLRAWRATCCLSLAVERETNEPGPGADVTSLYLSLLGPQYAWALYRHQRDPETPRLTGLPHLCSVARARDWIEQQLTLERKLRDLEKIKIHALLVFLAVVSVVIPVT
ncbi:MAG: hypothetical protein HKM94_07355 [Halobacteria archaeon]|nr:hypothetical protein [Halobacteria archaeon]